MNKNPLRLTIYFLFCCLFSFHSSAYAVRGVMDLRLESFQSPIPLEGQWEIYWHKLLTTRDQFDGSHYTEFPGIWKGQIVDNDTLTAFGYATYRLKLILPKKPQDYELFIDDMYCSYNIYLDGQLIANNGVVGNSLATSNPEWRPLLVTIKNQSGIVELVVNVSNWRHSKGGAANPILISKAGILSKSLNQSKLFQTALFTLFIIASLFFFYRFVFKSYELASFYFALFLVTYSYRLVGADLYLLHEWVPNYPWLVGIKLEYLSLFLSTLFFALYGYHLYPEETSMKWVRPLLIACLSFAAIVLITPVPFFTQSLLPFFSILIVYIAYGFYIFTTAAINGRRGATYGVLSVSVVFIIFIYQMFYYIGWLEYVYELTFIAHLLFLILQSLQLYTLSEDNLKTLASTNV